MPEPHQDTSGNQITEDLTVSTLSERDLLEDEFAREKERAAGAKPLGLWADTWRRLKRNRLAIVGLCIIIVFVVVGSVETIAYLAGGYVAPYDPIKTDYALSPQGLGSPPSLSHPIGTDYLGRDVFSRVLVATRISMLVGVIAVAIALIIGLILGPISGYYGGWVDSRHHAHRRRLLRLPVHPVRAAAAHRAAAGVRQRVHRHRHPQLGHVTRASTAARCSASRPWSTSRRRAPRGPSDLRVIFRHVLPNTMAPVYVAIAMGIGGAITTEAALAFLGLGVQPPEASWGKMISDNLTYLAAGSWWMLAFPSFFLVVTVFGFISFGNGLRDATDPKLKE